MVQEFIKQHLTIKNVILTTETKGIWESTVLGLDYTYAYPNDTTLAVTIKKAGIYKINYYA